MNLIQPLPAGPLDIIGDVHGEYDALCALLRHLGYNRDGEHPDGRTLVFVGDFCDRGPNSPAVLAWVSQLMQSSRAAAVLGNHEINLLRGNAKDGSGWFFDKRLQRHHDRYAPFHRPTPAARTDILALLCALPSPWSARTCGSCMWPGNTKPLKPCGSSPGIRFASHTTAGNRKLISTRATAHWISRCGPNSLTGHLDLKMRTGNHRFCRPMPSTSPTGKCSTR